MSSPEVSTAQPTGKLDREVIVIASVVVVGAIMSILDTTIVNVALDTLSRKLHSPLSTIQWVSTGYLVALAMVIPLTGWAAERFGTKRLWMSVVVLFALGSALSGLAWSAGSLIGFRVLQGLGGGMIMPAGMTILAQAAGPRRVGRVMAVVGVPMLLGPVLGPVIGGAIVQSLSWRWIFYVNLPIAALAFGLAWRLLPRSKREHGQKLDAVGLALLSPGSALIVFGLSETSSHGGIAAPIAWGPVVVGLALVAAFVRHALRERDRQPLLDLTLFRRPGFSAAAVTVFLVSAALFGSLLALPLYFQIARGETVFHTGLLLVGQGLGAAIAMPLSGRMTDRVGGGRVTVVGLAVMTVATFFLTRLAGHTSFVLVEAILFVRGLGLAGTMMPSMAAAYATLSRAAVPRATTALNVIQRVGGSVGTALLAVVLESQLKSVGPPGGGGGGNTTRQIPPQVREHLANPLAAAFAHTFWYATALTVVAIPAAFLLARKDGVPDDENDGDLGDRGSERGAPEAHAGVPV